MCGGMLGEAIGGIDKAANSINPMLQPMKWATDNTVGKVFKPAGQLYDFSNSHPLESLAAMAAIYGGGVGLGAWGGAGAAGAEGAGAGGAGLGATDVGAGALDTGSTNLFADAVPGAGGDVGATAAGMSGAGADTAGIGTMAGSGGGSASGGMGSFLSSVFGGGSGGTSGGFGFNLGTAKNALGAMQVLSSLYGMDQSRKLSKKASSGAISNAGLQAVQRSMAAQGFLGSGNMMTALSKYGADAYQADLGQQQQALSNQMSGLGLLTAGFGNLAGWGQTGGGKP